MQDVGQPPSPRGPGEPGSPQVTLEARITRRARDFELGALLALLRAQFPERSLRFRSHPATGTQAGAVHDVEFAPDAVVITLNLGLFSSTTPLPSYFNEWLSGASPVRGIEAILSVLDDQLLRDRADGALVTNSPRLLAQVDAVGKNLLQLARPASPSTLRWLFARVFPELGVSVSRAGVHRALATDELRLGHARLGHTAMGGEADVLTPGYDVFLATGESTTWRGEPWPREAQRRLEQRLFPTLAETAVHLRILLFDFEGSMRLSLIRGSTFGFDPLKRAASPHVIVLHEGRVAVGSPRDARAS
jgi:hypothetical protein